MRTNDNKLIAEFMGKEWHKSFFSDVFIISPSNITYKFDSDWNWLMPVVEKILDISLNMDSMEMYYNITDCVPRIDQAYKAVVDFIKWYNEQKHNEN